MTYVSHFRFLPDPHEPDFQQLSVKEYDSSGDQAVRTRSGTSIKDRSGMEVPPIALTACRIQNVPRHSARDENLRRFILSPSNTIKAIGYNSAQGASVASTGTSVINRLCITDGMGPCVGVAIGGEKAQTGDQQAAAKIRVFHVFPNNDQAGGELRKYISKLQDAGYSVRAAMHGGEKENKKSRTVAEGLRTLITELNVQVDFDEACERRNEDKPIGAVIQDDHSVKFVTELAQVVM